jgi:hypothetical protein
VHSLEQAIDGTLAGRRFNAWIVALFGYAALALTACGIYAISAHAVSARSRELGIRAALGAPPQGLVRLVLRTDFAAVIAGIGAGLIGAPLPPRSGVCCSRSGPGIRGLTRWWRWYWRWSGRRRAMCRRHTQRTALRCAC